MMISLFPVVFGLQDLHAATPQELLAEVKALASHRQHLLAEHRPNITDGQYLQALGGEAVSGIEIHEGMEAGQGWGVTVFEEPVERVWATLTNEEVMDGKMSLDVSAVVKGPEYGHGRFIFQSLDLPRPLTDRYWITQISHGAEAFRKSKGALWELSWVDVNKEFSLAGTEFASFEEKATPVDWTKGAWLLIPLSNGHTLVEYFIWSDPGGFIPPALASRFAPGQVLKTLESMESIVVEQLSQPIPTQSVKPDGSSF